MPIVPVTFYRVECDHRADTPTMPRDCQAVSPDPNAEEYAAWAEEAGAVDHAIDTDWQRKDDGTFLCPDHREVEE